MSSLARSTIASSERFDSALRFDAELLDAATVLAPGPRRPPARGDFLAPPPISKLVMVSWLASLGLCLEEDDLPPRLVELDPVGERRGLLAGGNLEDIISHTAPCWTRLQAYSAVMVVIISSTKIKITIDACAHAYNSYMRFI